METPIAGERKSMRNLSIQDLILNFLRKYTFCLEESVLVKDLCFQAKTAKFRKDLWNLNFERSCPVAVIVVGIGPYRRDGVRAGCCATAGIIFDGRLFVRRQVDVGSPVFFVTVVADEVVIDIQGREALVPIVLYDDDKVCGIRILGIEIGVDNIKVVPWSDFVRLDFETSGEQCGAERGE